jgi:hypothetical protein
MTGGFQDPELAGDLVGVTSARLLAAGVPRAERLHAMRLLGVLVDAADAGRRVRRPVVELAVEFDLPGDEVGRWLDHLLGAGALRWEDGKLIVAAVEPPPAGGLRLHDFLSLVAEGGAGVPVGAAAPPRRRSALVRPVGAALAAAAVVALALVGPGVVHDRATPVSSTRDEAPAATSTVPPTRAGTGTTDTTGGDLRPSTTGPAAAVPRSVPGPEPLGPVIGPTTSTIELACPVGLPVVTVLGSTTDAQGQLVVDGVARNRSTEEIVIHEFTLTASVAGHDVTGPGARHDLVVPARSTVLWQATLPVAAPPGTTVQATLGDWVWGQRDVATTCPSP